MYVVKLSKYLLGLPFFRVQLSMHGRDMKRNPGKRNITLVAQ